MRGGTSTGAHKQGAAALPLSGMTTTASMPSAYSDPVAHLSVFTQKGFRSRVGVVRRVSTGASACIYAYLVGVGYLAESERSVASTLSSMRRVCSRCETAKWTRHTQHAGWLRWQCRLANETWPSGMRLWQLADRRHLGDEVVARFALVHRQLTEPLLPTLALLQLALRLRTRTPS